MAFEIDVRGIMHPAVATSRIASHSHGGARAVSWLWAWHGARRPASVV